MNRFSAFSALSLPSLCRPDGTTSLILSVLSAGKDYALDKLLSLSLQIRGLWYDTSRKLDLDTLLLVVAQTGVFIYAAFCIIGSFFQLQDHLIAFLASLATLVQATLQTLFILDASSRYG